MQKTTSWEEPQRQSPAAIFIIFLRSLIRLLKAFWPLMIFYLIPRAPQGDEAEALAEASRFNWWLFSLSLIIMGLGILLALLRYWHYRFSLKKSHLEIQSGFFNRKQLSIPLENIQAVHLEQGLWQRLLGVYRVAFDSTGSEEMESRIDALPKAKALALKDFIRVNTPLVKSEENPEKEAQKEVKRGPEYRLDTADLIKLSLSANHLQAFAILLAFGFQLYDDLQALLPGEEQKVLEQYARNGASLNLWLITSFLILLLGVSVLISAGRTLLKYYDFHFKEEDQNWRLSFGLITRHQRFTPIRKIQMVHYQANWLRRKINLWLMSLQSVGQKKAQAELRLAFPMSSKTQAESLASHYLDIRPFEGLEPQGISPAYWQRISLYLGIFLAFLGAALGYWLHPGAAVLALGLWVYSFWHYYHRQQNFRWKINAQGVYLESGVWGRRYDLLRWEKIQELELGQTLYQRRRNLASLRFRTAGGDLSIPFLKLEIAQAVQNYGLYYLESQKKAWL